VTVPKADAGSKEPGVLTVKLAPELLRARAGSGVAAKVSAARAKSWLPANFKLEIDGLDCKKVSKIEALSFKVKVAEDQVGEERIATKEPTSIEVPNLQVTLAESGSQTWTAWFDDFVVKGLNGDENEKSGKLSFLTPDLKSTLAEVRFFNLGIFRLEPEPRAAARRRSPASAPSSTASGWSYRSSRRSTSPGAPRSSQATRYAGRSRAPSSGTRSHAERASSTGWSRTPS
jgi:hypothetical protein